MITWNLKKKSCLMSQDHKPLNCFFMFNVVLVSLFLNGRRWSKKKLFIKFYRDTFSGLWVITSLRDHYVSEWVGFAFNNKDKYVIKNDIHHRPDWNMKILECSYLFISLITTAVSGPINKTCIFNNKSVIVV